MSEWDRTDYDALVHESRWKITLVSRDPALGVSPVLLIILTLAVLALTISQ